MKKYILGSLGFCVFMLIVFFLYELLLFTRPNEYSFKQEYMDKHLDDIKVLILGHSQLEQGLKPSEMGDSVFNLAIEGRPTYYDAVLAQCYVPRMKNLKYVIWPLAYNFQFNGHPFSLHDIIFERDGMMPTYHCMYYKYMGIPCGSFSFLCWSEILNSKYEFGKRLYTRDMETLTGCDSLGFHSNGVHNPAAMNQTLPSEVNYDAPDVQKRLAEGMDDILSIARVCKAKGVHLIVLTPPAYKNYQKLLTKRGLYELKKVVDKMKEVNPSVEYHSYLFDSRFVEEDFFNSSHLAERGAVKFSKIVGRLIK